MNRLGNLDNLSLGMGLRAKAGEVLPAKFSSFEGMEDSKNYIIPGLLIILVILMAKKYL